MQPLLYDYNEYGERVGMRTFQTTPEGDPSHVENTGAKTAWHFHEATGSLLRKEYADGKGPEYAYNEAGQLAERRWARESSPQRAQRGTEAEGNPAVAGTGTAGVPPASQAGAAASRIITAYTYDPATLQLAKGNGVGKRGRGTNIQFHPGSSYLRKKSRRGVCCYPSPSRRPNLRTQVVANCLIREEAAEAATPALWAPVRGAV